LYGTYNPLSIGRFGEALRITQDHLDSKNFYAFNPSFDTRQAMALRQERQA